MKVTVFYDEEDENNETDIEEGILGYGEEHEEEGQEEVVPTALGPEPVFTGLLTPSGRPIFRHPIVVKIGFQGKKKEYHCPTLEGQMVNRIIGWTYDA